MGGGMKITIFVLIACLCQAAYSADKKMEKLALTKGKDVVAGQLKDPESARFKNLKAREDGMYLCGEVNAKNSFGGYVGFRRFYALWPVGVVRIEGSNEEFADDIWTKHCSDN
jgi:hypothetical protein